MMLTVCTEEASWFRRIYGVTNLRVSLNEFFLKNMPGTIAANLGNVGKVPD